MRAAVAALLSLATLISGVAILPSSTLEVQVAPSSSVSLTESGDQSRFDRVARDEDKSSGYGFAPGRLFAHRKYLFGAVDLTFFAVVYLCLFAFCVIY
jgi:hypothetical protein